MVAAGTIALSASRLQSSLLLRAGNHLLGCMPLVAGLSQRFGTSPLNFRRFVAEPFARRRQTANRFHLDFRVPSRLSIPEFKSGYPSFRFHLCIRPLTRTAKASPVSVTTPQSPHAAAMTFPRCTSRIRARSRFSETASRICFSSGTIFASRKQSRRLRRCPLAIAP